MDTNSAPPSVPVVPTSSGTLVTAQEVRAPVVRRSLVRRRSVWVIGIIVLAGAGVLGYNLLIGKAKVSYATATVARGDVESTVVAAGVLRPVRYVDVGAQISGKLKTLKVKQGDHVEENQLLAEIDPVIADNALDSANATLENMVSQRSVRQAQLVLAQVQRDRNEQLFTKLILSKDDRDVTRAGYAVAFANVASLTAQMKQATAAVDTAVANLGYTKITAPMAGDVVSITALEGQTLNANQQAPTILRIADLSTMTVWAQVSEGDIGRVKIGQHVYFTVLGQTRRWRGTIQQVLPTPELLNNVVFYDVLFDIPNPGRELNIQMTAQVFIVLAQAKGALLIPSAAVGNAKEGATIKVQVLNADGRVEPRTITIGVKSEISVEVTSGLQEHERVVLRGAVPAAADGGARSPLATGGRRGF